MLIVDEAHEYRTGGPCFEALIHMRDKSLCTLAITATPLYNSEKVLNLHIYRRLYAR